MTSETTFSEASIECAKQFLENVVVIDNQLFFEGEGRREVTARPVIVPTPDPAPVAAGPVQADENEVQDQSEPQDQDQRRLNAKVLVEAFADMGITCCPYRPGDENDDEIVSRATQIARNADIVVLDWTLGNTGETRAVQILDAILKDDDQRGGRLRLVAIYTGDRRVFEIINTVRENVFDQPLLVEGVEGNDQTFTVTNGQATVVFVNKGTIDTPMQGIEAMFPDRLPDYLVLQFSKLTNGLMPNVALSSITAIRAASHHILGRFDSQLDPAVLAHRALLNNPEDAEEFSVNLVGDEIRAILRSSEVGVRELGLDRIRLWLEDRQSKGLKFGFGKPQKEGWKIDAPILLLRDGSGAKREFAKKYKDSDGNVYGLSRIETETSNLFSENEQEAEAAHLKLSRRNLLDVEAADWPFIADGWKPTLRLGTILHREGDEFQKLLLCIRPLCDCVRLKSTTEFNWITLTREDNLKNFQFVVMLPSKEVCVYSAVDSNSGDNVQGYKFNPKSRDRIYASRVGDDFFFNSTGRKRFQWVGYLKIPFANRELEKLARLRSRQGVDEYEWLRLKIKGN